MKITKPLLAATLSLAALAAAPVEAATVMSSVDLSTATTNSSFSLAGFDTNLGTLTSVLVTITGSMTATGSYTAMPLPGGGSYPIQIFVANPSASVIFPANFPSIFSAYVPYAVTNGVIPEFFFGQGATVTASGTTGGIGLGTTDALTAFSQNSISLTASNPLSVYWFAGPGAYGSGALQATSRSLLLTAAYTYTPMVAAPLAAVPEPATWAMMILGLGMVGGAMRYRRRATRVRFA